MSDFQLGGRGGYRPNGIKRNEQRSPQVERTPNSGEGGQQRYSAEDLQQRYSDELSPELAARMRDRRQAMPSQMGPQEGAMSPMNGQDRRQGRGQFGQGIEGGESPMGGRHRHGRPPMEGGPQGQMGGPRAPMEPTQAVEDFFTKADANGDGAVTKDEALAFFQAEADKRNSAVASQPEQGAIAEEAPVTEEPTIEELLTALPVAEESVTTKPTTEEPDTEGEAVDYAAVQSDVLAQLEEIQSQEGLTDEQKTLLSDTYETIKALDPADAEFENQLNEALAIFG